MNEAQFVVEYKTTGELFKQQFVYTTYCTEFETHFLFINDNMFFQPKYFHYDIQIGLRYNRQTIKYGMLPLGIVQ